jgi:hypothetical protein
MRRLLLAGAGALLVALILAPANPAGAHEERETRWPDGTGTVPAYRTDGPRILVCKTDRADFERRTAGFPTALRESNLLLWEQCQRAGYRHLQEAVDAARLPNTNISVLPGLYQEEPSLAPPTSACANLDAPRAALGYQVLSWEQQLACPNNQNLVAVLDKRGLQIEGTGAAPTDVVVDAQYQKLNAIRADRADGFYLRNLTAQRTTFNAVYVMETDGFVIDRATGRWNDEYGFLTFANDHGLYTDCEAYGNGDSGVYPGASSNINKDKGHDVERYAIEIKGCYSHHNLLGYSGTAGDSVWAHDNRFTENTAGIATDSAFPDHPGMPQNHAKFEDNDIGNNNIDYFRHVRDGTCAKPTPQRGYEQGVVCPAVGLPAGTGVINPGGNYNIWRNNHIYGHQYAGIILNWVPGFVRNDGAWPAQFDTSHHNRVYGNRFGVSPTGEARANRIDVWWDGQGRGNCWQSAPNAEPLAPPACDAEGFPGGLGSHRYVAEPGKVLKLYECNGFNLERAQIPSNCDWFGARGLERAEVQAAAVEAVLLSVAVLALWWRRLRGWPGALAAAGAVMGVVLGVFGTAYEGTPLVGIAFAMQGAGLLGAGWLLRRNGYASLGWLTVALGAVTLVNAVDRTLWMIPWLPVPPSLVRILLELVWVPWVLTRIGFSGRARRTADQPGY